MCKVILNPLLEWCLSLLYLSSFCSFTTHNQVFFPIWIIWHVKARTFTCHDVVPIHFILMGPLLPHPVCLFLLFHWLCHWSATFPDCWQMRETTCELYCYRTPRYVSFFIGRIILFLCFLSAKMASSISYYTPLLLILIHVLFCSSAKWKNTHQWIDFFSEHTSDLSNTTGLYLVLLL